MKTFFKELFEYNYQINQKLEDVFNANPNQSSEKALKLYSHILNAHRIWNNRIAARDNVFGVWDMHAVSDFRHIDNLNFEHTLDIISQLDLNSTINYKIKGKASAKKISGILFHVINHSTYHKGQIATEFRQNGLDPLVIDYILYEKE